MERTQAFAGILRIWKGVLLGLAVSLGAAALLTLFFSLLLVWGVPDGWIPFFAHLTVLLAAIVGGMAAGWKGKANGLLSGLCAGLGLFLVHLLLTGIFGDLSLSCLTFLLCEGMGGVLGGIFGVNLRRT